MTHKLHTVGLKNNNNRINYVSLNPLECIGNYSATSNIIVGTLAADELAVTFGTARMGLGGAASRPAPSNGQCTNHGISV